MPDAAIAVPQKEQTHKLLKTDFNKAGYAYGKMQATLPVGWTIEEALKPEFWSNVSYILQKQIGSPSDHTGTIIELRSADHSFYAELYVRAVQDRGLLVSLIGKPVHFGLKEVKSDSFLSKWNIGKRGFDIIRKSDGAIVGSAENIKTKEGAQEWIDQMTRTS